MIRQAHPRDLEQILALFRESVCTICAKDYSPEQLRAWAGRSSDKERWLDYIQRQYFLVYLREGVIAGFASLEGRDYLALLYVAAAFQRSGVATALYEQLLSRARELGAQNLQSDVSVTAVPFFLAKGWTLQQTKQVRVDGVSMTNHHMTLRPG